MMRSAMRTLAGLLVAAAASATPLLAEAGPESCYERVLAMCDEALDAAAWWEKPAIGVLCTGMLAGCAGADLLPGG